MLNAFAGVIVAFTAIAVANLLSLVMTGRDLPWILNIAIGAVTVAVALGDNG